MRTIGLCMIARNEAPVIERCLRSVRALVDYVLVEDTGSDDGTQDIVRAFLAREGIPGEVFDEPWRDFAANRTIGLQRLRRNAAVDYALVMDADDVLAFAAGFDPAAFKGGLDKDVYDVAIRHDGIRYTRPLLCSNRLPFRFCGVLHEYLCEPPGASRGAAPGIEVLYTHEGARSRNPRKYADDARTLERALESEADPFLRARYTYYLAQSWRDAGEPEKALPHFLARAGLGYWVEEAYVSLLSAARIMQGTGRPLDEVLAIYGRAAAACPWRAESFHGAAQLCNRNGRPAQALAVARRGLGLRPPEGGLFVESWIYEYGLRDEFAVAAYWAGAPAESLEACLALLADVRLPEAERARVAANAHAALARMAPPAAPEHAPRSAPPSRDPPRVLVPVLAERPDARLPLALACLEALDYPRQAITLYVRTNGKEGAAADPVAAWLRRVGHLYGGLDWNAAETSADGFAAAATERNACLRKALEHGCAFLFLAEPGSFVRPAALGILVAAGLPIAAPLLRSVVPGDRFANFFAAIDANGYFRDCPAYDRILEQQVRGLIEVPVAHGACLVRRDVLADLDYADAAGRHPFVAFSASARRAGVAQYLDNRQVYGCVARDEERECAMAERLMRGVLERAVMAPDRAA